MSLLSSRCPVSAEEAVQRVWGERCPARAKQAPRHLQKLSTTLRPAENHVLSPRWTRQQTLCQPQPGEVPPKTPDFPQREASVRCQNVPSVAALTLGVLRLCHWRQARHVLGHVALLAFAARLTGLAVRSGFAGPCAIRVYGALPRSETNPAPGSEAKASVASVVTKGK